MLHVSCTVFALCMYNNTVINTSCPMLYLYCMVARVQAFRLNVFWLVMVDYWQMPQITDKHQLHPWEPFWGVNRSGKTTYLDSTVAVGIPCVLGEASVCRQVEHPGVAWRDLAAWGRGHCGPWRWGELGGMRALGLAFFLKKSSAA